MSNHWTSISADGPQACNEFSKTFLNTWPIALGSMMQRDDLAELGAKRNLLSLPQVREIVPALLY